MNRRPVVALALSLTALGCSAPNAKYIVDPTQTFAMYEIGHHGTTTNRGRFSTIDAWCRSSARPRPGRSRS